MEDRTPLSSVIGKTISSIGYDDNGDLRLIDDEGNCFAIVSQDSLFDAEGNYHEDDLD